MDETIYTKLTSKTPEKKVVSNKNTWSSTGVGNYPDVSIRPVGPTAAFMVRHTVGAGGSLPARTDENDILIKENEKQYKKLWVHEISFGWSMDYQESQTVFGKSFYPRHMQVGNVTVKGQTASQSHYDSIVETILDFQKQSVIPESSSESNQYAFDIIRFEIPAAKYAADTWRQVPYLSEENRVNRKKYTNVVYKYDRIWFDGYPLNIKAGHKKGIYNPEFEITFALLSYKSDIDVIDRSGGKAKDFADYSRKTQSTLLKSMDPNLTTLDSISPAVESGYNAMPGGPGAHPIEGPN